MMNLWLNRRIAQLKHFYYGISFKRRLSSAFLLLIALSTAVVGFSSYTIASKELQKNTFESSQETVDKTRQIMDDKLYNVSKTVRSIMLSDAFNMVMHDVQSNIISNYYIHLSELQYVFSQAIYNEPLIESILIATPIGDFYPVSQRRAQNQSFYESNLYYLAEENYGGLWLSGHNDVYFTGNNRVLSYVMKGTQDNLSNTNVYFIVNVSESGLIGVINKSSSHKDNIYSVVDLFGDEVMRTSWSSQQNLRRDQVFLDRIENEESKSFFHEFNKTEYLVNYSRSEIANDWILFGIQPKDKLLAQLMTVQRTTIIIMIIFLLVALLLSNKLTSLLLLPLYRLRRLMREVESNRLTVRFESDSRDEVAQVGFQFNRMLDEITNLIQDVRESESGKREAQMRALTAQMEPHFLYNTLNTIYCKSVLGENQEVSKMILALAQMFQLGLSGGKDWNMMADELSHVEQYCAIQSMCYEGLFEYEVKVADPDLLHSFVPKIILQPIVENSIQHGFRDIGSGGFIQLTVQEDKGLLHIVINDNGAGIDEEKMGVKWNNSIPFDSKKGVALHNISDRLSLYYGEEARMEIKNLETGGARTDLWIPMRKGEV
ncbi:MAG: sensor histidine kinase [Candidatus Pristimantibacillus sp.]